MSYRVVIVDDEKPARERLKRLLAPQEDFDVAGEAGDASAAIALIDSESPDLLFLDVRMPEGDGFRVLEEVEHVPQVIFTTAYDEYAVRAFEVNSLDYLLKPFGKRRFGEALERARRALGGGTERSAGPLLELLEQVRRGAPTAAPLPPRISARRGSKIVLLDPAEVRWFEAEDTLVFANTQRGRFLVERTLAELEDSLAPRFFRAHRGCLVNLSHIAEILPGESGNYRIVFRGPPEAGVPLSRRQARKLREIIPW